MHSRRGRVRRRVLRAFSAVLAVLLVGGVGLSILGPTAGAIGPGAGIIVYSDGSTNEPWVREWDGVGWSSATLTDDVHEWRTVDMAASRTRDEIIAVGLNIHNEIRGEMWDGSTWAEFPFTTPMAKVDQNQWWSQAVEYERLSDHAVMVWANGTSSTTPMSYRVWDGSSWSAAQTISVPVSSKARQIHLAASPDSDEMVMVMSDDGSRDYAFVWDGSAWGAAHTLSSSGGGDNRTDIAVAYEQQSGDALVVYGKGSSTVYHQTWDGLAWSAEGTLAIPSPATGNVLWSTLGSDPTSDRVALGVSTGNSDIWLAVWDGSGWGSTQVATQNASGTLHPAVDVAFESSSGQALALYGIGSTDPRYRTFDGSSWSAEASAFDVGDTPNTVVLDADPYSDKIMATVQDAGSDLSAALWSGSSWGSVSQLEDDTREISVQPWAFVWGVYDEPPAFEASYLYLDEFNASSFSGSDGTADWTPNPWVEIGESDGPGSGAVRVGTSVPSTCLATGGCLGIDDRSTIVGARRTADIDGASAATLSFLYWVEDDGGSLSTAFSVQVSDSVSGPWTTLATYVADTTSTSPISQSFDITDFASGTTTIRVVSSGEGESEDDEIYLDDVRIDASFGLDDRTDDEGDPIDFTLRANDPLGDSLTYSATGLPPGISIDPGSGAVSGTIGQTAAAGSPYSVTFTVSDPQGNTDTASFSWTVIEVNAAPVLSDLGDQSDAEGDSVSITWGATDADGDVLTWSASGLPPGLSIDPGSGLISGTIDYTAASGSPYSFTITVEDDGSPSLSDSVTRQWTVSDTNRPPEVIPPADRSDAEGDSVSVTISASDPDGDAISFSAFGLPDGLSIGTSTGVISGTIGFDAASGSPHSVLVRVTDDGSPVQETDVTFTWTVTNTNRPPSVDPLPDRSDAEATSVAFNAVGTDPDGDGLTWSATGLPAGMSIDPSSGLISGTLSYDAEGIHPVFVRATDDGTPAEFDEVSFTWTVTNTNRAPVVANPGDQVSGENDAVSLQVDGSDPDGDGITWSATGLPDGLSIDPSTGVISGTIDYDSAASSPYAVTVRATDDDPASMFDEVSFTWTVSDTNRPPAVTDPGEQSDAEADAVTLSVSGSDPDGDGITWSATGLPEGLGIDPATGVISGTIGYDAAPGSPYAVTVRATDDGSPSLFTEVSFSWSVANTNRAPVVTNPGDQSDAEADAVTLDVSGSDPDGNGLTWSATGLPGGLGIDPATGRISGTLTFTSAGTHAVTVRATDGGSPSLYDEESFTWTVANTNRAPVVSNPGTQSTEEGGSVSLAITASDPDGNSIGFEADGLPDGLTISPTTGVISGTLGYSLSSSYSVTVIVTDGGTPAASSQVTFTWNIGEVNRPPALSAIADQTGEQDSSVTFTASASDPDTGDGLRFSASGLPAGVSIGATSGVISGVPTQAGAYTVTVTVVDDGTPQLSDEETFTWTVVSPPGFPTISSVSNRSGLTGDVVRFEPNGSHSDGLALTWSATGLPTGLSIDPVTGEITGILEADGDFEVVVELTDERDQSVAASFSWTVTDPDLPPVAEDDTVHTALDALVGGSVAIDVIGNDHDPEGQPLTLVSAGPAEFGAIRIVDGLVLFDPPHSWLGTDSFTYVVADPSGNETSATVTVTIEEALSTRIAAAALQWDPATPSAPDTTSLVLDPSTGTELVLGTVVQSLYVLRVPLALLGGAVFWSLLLGGILNLGFVIRGGVPTIVRRTSRNVAVVMAAHGEKVHALDKPGSGLPIWRYTATDRGVEATGRRADGPDGTWAEVATPNGRGWLPLINLTEEVDRASFADDPEPLAMVRDFVTRLRARRDFSDMVSMHGLAIAHHGPVRRFGPDEVEGILDDPIDYIWKGRNPAYPDFRGTFDNAVATSILDAWDHPQRELVHDAPTLPSTVVPVEFTNFHTISIGADVHGPERLDQSAWLIVFANEGGRPRIIGLVKEG